MCSLSYLFYRKILGCTREQEFEFYQAVCTKCVRGTRLFKGSIIMIKKVAVINDLSGFGKCSLAVAISVLSVMGVQACPVPTAVLTNQTEFKNHYCVDLTDELCHYTDMWSKNGEEFDGIYSGYVASERQIELISDFMEKFRKSHTKIIVDPVMADNGALYPNYSTETCEKMKALAKSADIITPNLTELCILADYDYKDLSKKADDENYLEIISEIARGAIAHSAQQIAVTGIEKDGFLYNGVFAKDKSSYSRSVHFGNSYSGTGDIFASIICASVVKGESFESAVEKATSFLEEVLEDTSKDNIERNYGSNYEKFLHKLY